MQNRNAHNPTQRLKFLPSATSKIITQRPTANLTPRSHQTTSSYLLNRYFLPRFFDRGDEFRLQGRRVDSVGMQTFIDELGVGHECCERFVCCEDVQGGEGFVLGEAPDVEFVD